MNPDDVAALERRLREDPDDTDSWLVYADWLVEQGDVGGQVLHWQHELERGGLDADREAALRRGITAAVDANRKAWLAGWAAPPGLRVEWRGGFVRRAGGLPGSGPALALLWAPRGRFVEALSLSAIGDVTPLLEAPETRWLRELAVEGGSFDLSEAPTAPGLSSLRRLALRHTVVAGIDAWLRWPGLPGLAELALEGVGADDAWAEALAAAPFGALRRLDLASNRIGDRGAEALAAAPFVRGLEQLRLVGNTIGDRGAAALAAATSARLDLRGNRVSLRAWVPRYADLVDPEALP